jgi:GTPase SAR1 family protein
MVLASNKLDLLSGDEEELYEYQQQEFLDRFAKEHGFIESIRCSAKEDIEIAQLFSALTREMLIKEIKELENEDDNDYVDDGEFRDERTGSLTLSANQAGGSVNASQQDNRVKLDQKAQAKKKDKKCC